MKRILASLVLLTALNAHAQTGFQAKGTGGALRKHDVCEGTGCIVDNRISMTSTTGFTSTADVEFTHVNGRDFAIAPEFGVYTFGNFQIGTGSLLFGDLTSLALLGADQSYVKISSNGSCGQFKADGTCKVGGFVPTTDTLFVGVFVGNISWMTNADGSHTLQGTARGFVNGGTTVVFLNLTAQTLAANFNGQALGLASISIAPF